MKDRRRSSISEDEFYEGEEGPSYEGQQNHSPPLSPPHLSGSDSKLPRSSPGQLPLTEANSPDMAGRPPLGLLTRQRQAGVPKMTSMAAGSNTISAALLGMKALGIKPRMPEAPPMPLLRCKFDPPPIAFTTATFLLINMGLNTMAALFLVLGSWLAFRKNAVAEAFVDIQADLKGEQSPVQRGMGIGLLVAGALAFSVGMVGTCAFLQSHPRWLFIYAKLMMVIMACHIIAFFTVIGMRHALIKKEFLEVKEGIRQNYEGHNRSKYVFSRLADRFMVKMDCCGAWDHTDFRDSKWHKIVNKRLYSLQSLADTMNKSVSDLTDSEYNTLLSQLPEDPYAPTAYEIENKYNLKCLKLTKQRGQMWDFPPTCCKKDLNDRFEDPDCLCKEASGLNKNTVVSCFGVTRDYIDDQVFLIVGLAATFFSMEISAISNAMGIAKKIQKEESKRLLAQIIAAQSATSFIKRRPGRQLGPGDSPTKQPLQGRLSTSFAGASPTLPLSRQPLLLVAPLAQRATDSGNPASFLKPEFSSAAGRKSSAESEDYYEERSPEGSFTEV